MFGGKSEKRSRVKTTNQPNKHHDSKTIRQKLRNGEIGRGKPQKTDSKKGTESWNAELLPQLVSMHEAPEASSQFMAAEELAPHNKPRSVSMWKQ